MCDRPLKGFKIGYTKNGKPNYLVCSPEVKYVWSDNNDCWHKSYDFNRSNFVTVKDVVKEYTLIPCGSCLSCRIARAGELADRCMLEMNYHDEACFVTLTYDELNLIRTNYTRTDTGETGCSNTLFKKHYMDFFKRLRKANPGSDIRYVLAGEYGEQSDRAHYHALIFGYKPHDLRPVSVNRRGQPLYMSEELNRIWQKGNCIVGDVTKDSANYVCRYVTKKLYSDIGMDNYQMRGRIPPFIVTSKRPAIGKRWYDDNKDWCLDQTISYATPSGGRTFTAPRYFKKLAEKEGLLTFERCDIMDVRNSVNVSQNEYVKSVNGLSYEEIAEAKEREMESKNKVFTRDRI